MLRAMQTRASSFVLLGCTLGSLFAGCAYGEVRQVIRAQFASELNCREVELRRRDSWYAFEGPDQYKVIGCGETRTYTCPKNEGLVSYGKPACTWVKGDADAPIADDPNAPGAGGDKAPDESAPPAADEPGPSSGGDDGDAP